MNVETIELLKKVQDRKGEWRVLDYCWHLKFKDGLGVVLGTGKNSVLSIYFRGMDHHAYCESDDPDLLWLPPPTPRWPGDEGRNLWDMVDWKKWHMHSTVDGRAIMEAHGEADIVAPLPEALLRAIERKGE